VIPGKQTKKTQNMIYYATSKIYQKKIGQAADEIFRVAACPLRSLLSAVELVLDKLTPKN
jgi:hypothetical protein